MAWITPKTNWVATDYFNCSDYNRWKNNLIALKELTEIAYPSYQLIDMGADKTEVDFPYSDEFNNIENNIERICQNTYPFSVGEKMTFYDNMPIPDYNEFNRIESAMEYIRQQIIGQITGEQRLSFNLGRKMLGNRGI